MYCLFLDCSFTHGVAALFADGRLVSEVIVSREQSRHPCLLWQNMLEESSLSLEDISFLACGVGPGSYTGIRNAASTVKAVSLATNKPIVAVSSLLLFVPCDIGSYAVVVPGGIGGDFCQQIEQTQTGCILGEPRQERGEISFAERIEVIRPDMSNVSASSVVGYVYHQRERGNVYSAESLPLVYLRKTQAEIEKESRGCVL